MRTERPSSEIAEILKGVGPISFDMDGVIVFSVAKALEKTNKKLKSNFKLDDLREPFAMREWMKVDASIKDPVQEDFDLWHSEAVLAYAPIIPGAPTVCKLLANLGHEHYFITSRPAFVTSLTNRWFSYGLPWVKKEQILIQKETDVINSDFKADKIKEKKIAFHFEDAIEHAQKIRERTPAGVILVRHAWTKAYDELDEDKKDPGIIVPLEESTSLLLSFKAFLKHLRG